MTGLVVSLDLPTATEAVRVARSLDKAGCAARIGPRLLSRVGPGVVASVQAFVPVLADARLSGSVAEVGAAAQNLGSLGASWLTVAGSVGNPGLVAAVAAADRHGSEVYAVTVPPETTADSSRGKAVSRSARALVDTGVTAVLGTLSDLGVVVQVAPGLGVVVFGVGSPEEAAEAESRGAAAVVVDGAVARAADPALEVEPYRDALRSD